MSKAETAHTEIALQSEEDNTSRESKNEQDGRVRSREEKRVVLKQDLVILPLLALGFFFAYLDRGQIGNARVLGMQEDLGLTSQQFYNCVMMFYVGYMLIELPAGMMLRYFHPRYVFGASLVAFGTFAACLAVSRDYAAIMVLRLLIGLGEAFINNSWIFISLWYKPDEMSLRAGAIYCMTPVAGAISGLIAYGVGKDLEGASNKTSWEWLFIIEGVCTIGFGLVVVLMLPGLPEKVAETGSWLFPHEKERQAILSRYRESQNSEGATFRRHQIWLAFKDPKVYLGSLLIGAQGVGIGAFSVFLPTFIREFGFSVLQTQLYSMIPYAFALVSMIALSFLADRVGRKGHLTIICHAITCVGLVMLLCVTNKIALVAGACFVAGGAYPGLVIGIAFTIPTQGGYTKRATAVWITQVFVQLFSIMASQVYRSPPRFFLGHGVALGVYVLAILATVTLLGILSRANKAKEQRKREFEERGEVDLLAQKSIEDLGDFHPLYFYSM